MTGDGGGTFEEKRGSFAVGLACEPLEPKTLLCVVEVSAARENDWSSAAGQERAR